MQAKTVSFFSPPYDDDMPQGRPSSRSRPSFGQRLFEARQALGLSQTEVAEKLNMGQAGYAAWERDNVALRPDQICRLAKILNVSVDHLLGVEEKPNHKGGPTGKVRKVFEKVSRLPRHQQSKVVEFVDAFVERQLTEHAHAH
jgi:transcriptional regulator with XRE-family HTH domain